MSSNKNTQAWIKKISSRIKICKKKKNSVVTKNTMSGIEKTQAWLKKNSSPIKKTQAWIKKMSSPIKKTGMNKNDFKSNKNMKK